LFRLGFRVAPPQQVPLRHPEQGSPQAEHKRRPRARQVHPRPPVNRLLPLVDSVGRERALTDSRARAEEGAVAVEVCVAA
jgi:hypothetical protein